MNELSEIKSAIEKKGLYAEAIEKLIGLTRSRYEKNTSSIISYALWNAMIDVFSYFDNNQGIELKYSDKIDNALKESMCNLLSIDISNCSDQELERFISELIERLENIKLDGLK